MHGISNVKIHRKLDQEVYESRYPIMQIKMTDKVYIQ